MNSLALPAFVRPTSGTIAAPWAAVVRVFVGIVRSVALAALYPFALLDAAMVRFVTEPTGAHLAHARAAWLHRWCRIVRRVLGVRVEQRGYTPVSGIVAADHGSLLDAILLASVRPCVLVAGIEVCRRPVIGFLAKLGGTIFIDRQRRSDLARVHFMMQRAVHRRLLVVTFPECSAPRAFGSALFQPAAELGCTLTPVTIDHPITHDRDADEPHQQHVAGLLRHGRAETTVSFGAPRFRPGSRKDLARQFRGEALALRTAYACPQP